jgi:TrmH family RNA methyltransferase
MSGRSAAQPPTPLTSRRHPEIVRLRKMVRRPALAQRAGRFLLDGVHLLEEALAAPYSPEAIFHGPHLEQQTAGRALLAAMRAAGWPLRFVADDLLESLALTQSPQGVVGLFRRRPGPGALPAVAADSAGVRALVLDGLQDPVNVGVLARAARAFGCPLLITLEETVDPFHPRALRASSGLMLHLEVATAVSEAQLRGWLEAHPLRPVALVPRAAGRLPHEAPPGGGWVLLLGSEGHGLSPTLEAACRHRWRIPMAAEVDSLGVAAAGTIALYALSRWGTGGGARPGGGRRETPEGPAMPASGAEA